MTNGRARQFDYEAALERAEEIFREKGYGGAAVTELMAAMGIGAGSFYRAFGSKLGLCEEVLHRYVRRSLDIARRTLAHDELESALTHLVREMNSFFYSDANRPGCLFILLGGCKAPVVLTQWHAYRSDFRCEIERNLVRFRLPMKAKAELSSQVLSVIDILAVGAMTRIEPGDPIPLVEKAMNLWRAEYDNHSRKEIAQ